MTPIARLLLRRLCVAAICSAALCAAPARAEKTDRDKPINFQGDTGGGNAESKTGELVGHVIITQGTMTIHADKVVFKQNPDNSLSATAYGNPVSFREKRDDGDEYYEGFAQRAEYDGQKRVLELFDRALLKKGNDEIRSNYIYYNAGTEAFKAEGRPDSRPTPAGESPLGPRVRGVFQPQSKDGKDTKESKDAKAAPGKAASPLPLKADDAVRPERTR